MPAYSWDVQLPGEDLPHRVTTDYLLSEGEEVVVDGRTWLVESVDLEERSDEPVGRVTVALPREPIIP
jgi:hypothetical protein